ncbi:unnamed protein product [Auanema sp. JU1783]|nr:unnamed protein product [Auanema sp. JU1783]
MDNVEMLNAEMPNAEMPNAGNHNLGDQMPPIVAMELPELPAEQKQRAELKLNFCMDTLKNLMISWGFTSKQRVNYAVSKFLNCISLEIVNERVDYDITLEMPNNYKNYLLSNEYLLNGKYKAIKACALTDEEFDDYMKKMCSLLHEFMYQEGGSNIFGDGDGTEMFKDESISDEVSEDVDDDIKILRVVRLITYHRILGNHRPRPRLTPHGGGFVPFWHMMAYRLANNPLTDDVVSDPSLLLRNNPHPNDGKPRYQADPNIRRENNLPPAPVHEQHHPSLALPMDEIFRIAERNTAAARAREAAAAAAVPDANDEMEVYGQHPLLNEAMAMQRLNLIDNIMVGGESSTDDSDVEDVFVVSSDSDMDEFERNDDTDEED